MSDCVPRKGWVESQLSDRGSFPSYSRKEQDRGRGTTTSIIQRPLRPTLHYRWKKVDQDGGLCLRDLVHLLVTLMTQEVVGMGLSTTFPRCSPDIRLLWMLRTMGMQFTSRGFRPTVSLSSCGDRGRSRSHDSESLKQVPSLGPTSCLSRLRVSLTKVNAHSHLFELTLV